MGLANTVFLWNQQSNKIQKVVENENANLVSGVKFDKFKENLVVSCFSGSVKIFDLEKRKKVIEYTDN